MMQKKWFESWFDSPYYHVLYQNRNDEEAEFFIDNICAHLRIPIEANLLDVACGKGRHAIYLNKKGYRVTGIDLSPASIAAAQLFKNDRLQFDVHDIREVFRPAEFDIALNLFTSFGYFDTYDEHVNALKALSQSLKPNGLLILDYLNTEKAIQSLNRKEVKQLDGIDFHISREIVSDRIVKHIHFQDQAHEYTFQERVKAFTYADFEDLFTRSGFKIMECFGDYSLNQFDPKTANRLIFICQKTYA